ncbi:ARM repeat-containing protein [Nadsonia fulvescens var. elongata DSM 6958]|uniref:ARM repeat-containing protein n=1 Tax=Nadsonia fulvescens var. elongata DSM 6958 TaxID=857566 RepID=A0A1E3PGQ5_9ASCO|nr:ARM repeat-containing protein [Nadsonia fulvescens var. elongata DSM 6958]
MSFSPSFPTPDTHPHHHRMGRFKNRDRFQAQELKKRRVEQSQNLRRLKREEALQRTRNIIRNNLPANDNDISPNNANRTAAISCDLSQDCNPNSPYIYSASTSTTSPSSTHPINSLLTPTAHQSKHLPDQTATDFNSYVSNSNSVSSSVVSVSNITSLLKFLRRDETSQQIYALRSLRRLLVTHSDTSAATLNKASNLIEIIFSLNLVPNIIALLRSPYPSVRVEACWVLTTMSTIQTVSSNDLSNYISQLIHMGAIDGMLDLLRLSVWELQNFDTRGNISKPNVSNEINHMLISQELGLWALGTFLSEYENTLLSPSSTPIAVMYASEILPIIKSLFVCNFSSTSPSRLSTMGSNGENLQFRVAVKLCWIISILFRDSASNPLLSTHMPSGPNLASPTASPTASVNSYFVSSGVAESLDILIQLLVDHLKHNKITSDICWSLAYISDANSDYLSPIFDANMINLLFGILATLPPPDRCVRYNSLVKLPILKSLSNVCTGNPVLTHQIISTPGALNTISSLIASQNHMIEPDYNLLKECCWVVSNIVSGSSGGEGESAYMNLMIQANVIANISETVIMISGRGLCGDFADDAQSSNDVTTSDQFVRGMAYRLILKECCFTICNFLNGVLNSADDSEGNNATMVEQALVQINSTAFSYIFRMILTDDISLVSTVLETIKSILHIHQVLLANSRHPSRLSSLMEHLIEDIKQSQLILTGLNALFCETNDGVNALPPNEINSEAFSRQQQVHQLCVIIKDYLI